MCTLSPRLIACVTFTVSWKRVCGPNQASWCTKERPSFGMPLGRIHQVTRGCSEQRFLQILQQWCGGDPRICHHIVVSSSVGDTSCHQDFVRAQLEMLSAHHHTLLACIPMVEDVQSAWLLLVHCASARRTVWLEWSSPRWQPRFVRDMTPGCGSVCAEFSTYLQSKGTTWSELLPCLLFWEASGCDLLVVGAPQRSGRVGQTHCRCLLGVTHGLQGNWSLSWSTSLKHVCFRPQRWLVVSSLVSWDLNLPVGKQQLRDTTTTPGT